AELVDGSVVRGETNISKVGGSIKRVYLEPQGCKPMPAALAAIAAADVITIGPGSLYTSLLPPILVDRVADAIAEAKAIKIFVSNLMTQPGETDGLNARQHIEKFAEYAPQIAFDFLIVNNGPLSKTQLEKYTEEGAKQIGVHGSIQQDTIEGAEI